MANACDDLREGHTQLQSIEPFLAAMALTLAPVCNRCSVLYWDRIEPGISYTVH